MDTMINQEKLNPKFDGLLDEELENNRNLILHNDEVNTFDHVIDCLIEVCAHDSNQAEQCALITHYKGKCDVKTGVIEELSLMKDQLSSKGLSVTID